MVGKNPRSSSRKATPSTTSQEVQPAEPTEVEQQEVVPADPVEVQKEDNEEENPDPDSPDFSDEEQEQIEQALNRKTDDGPGEDPVPPSNFESFATPGVEKTHQKPLVTVVDEVLTGKWGDFSVRRQRLTDAGYNATEVLQLVNMRVAGGAPTAYFPSNDDLKEQVARGEWGASENMIAKNLKKAGYSDATIAEVAPRAQRD